MILESLKLENIRSYTNEEIKFPDGSLLLTGDIGSGKSTILLAIEFALFGIKTDLPGEALLRHGKGQGSVELKFSIGKNKIVVKRTLKRIKKAVRQDSGYIILNDRKIEGTATELKTKIISLLGYPESIISKSKDLIYRFTVYTPQEEMKQILYESKDIRLDTLRKVFGIDKYKRIRENIQAYVRELKTKKREFEASISDLEGKNQQKKGREYELNNVVNEIKDLQPDTNNIKESLEKQRKVIKEYERDTQDLNKLNNSLEVCDNNILNISEQSKTLGNEIEEAEKNIENIKKEVDEKSILNFEKIVKETKEKEKESREKEARLDEIKSKLGELLVLKKKSEGLKEKISKLDTCPLCKQKVTKEHIEKIQQEEKEKLKNIDEKIIIYKKQEVAGSDTIKNVKKGIDELKQQERKIEINKVKISNLKEKIERIVRLKKKKEELKNRVAEFNAKRIEIKTRIEKFRNIEEKYNREKEVLEKILEEQREFEIKLSELKKEKEMLEKQLLELQKEINKKLEIKKQINKVSQLQQWLDEYFINLMQAMEKQIMSKVYSEFNDLVREWFNMLIEDEVLNVRLDEEFTPMMEQNGYETSIDNLSGGEKTSVALAYRLALNKVINDLISGIKTKNLIILDEPTDGFSSDQLDRVKEVIDSLNMQQIIIVSHEPKIETFVDNILRVSKVEHTTHLV